MFAKNCKFLFLVWIGVASIVAHPELNVPSREFAQPIKQHSQFSRDAFDFEFYFDDGACAMEVGRFDKSHAYGKGLFRFNIQWKLYEFQYQSDERGTWGFLIYVSPNGQTIREEFSAPPVKSPNLSPVLLNDYHFGQFRLKNNFLMESYFPSQANSNRPSFGCEFYIKGGAPMLDCQTYENTTDHTISVSQRHESIATAVNEASAEHDRVKTRILDSENHYDESGNYIIKYVFDNGLAICEIGRVNHDDKTVTVYDGHIILDSHDFLTQWNYTADAKQYNVRQINDDRRRTLLSNGPHSEQQFTLKSSTKSMPHHTQLFSDGENRFEVYREFTEINGKPFVKATIKCNIESLGEMRFDINEAYAYGDTHTIVSSYE